MEYQHCLNLFIKVLSKHVPLKKKYLRANQGRFVTKNLHRAIMNRSRLRNKFLRNKTETSRKEYKKQQNFCSNLLRKAKKDHFAKLDVYSVTDNKSFWQTVKPLFSNKVKSHRIPNLLEKDNLICDDQKIAKIFKEYLVHVVQKLGIVIEKSNIKPTKLNLDEVNMAIIKYKNHIRTKAIKNRMEN